MTLRPPFLPPLSSSVAALPSPRLYGQGLVPLLSSVPPIGCLASPAAPTTTCTEASQSPPPVLSSLHILKHSVRRFLLDNLPAPQVQHITDPLPFQTIRGGGDAVPGGSRGLRTLPSVIKPAPVCVSGQLPEIQPEPGSWVGTRRLVSAPSLSLIP